MHDSAAGEGGFAGRMTPIAWLGIQHLNRCSGIVANASTDTVSLDAEVTWLWALWRSKVKETQAFKDWPKLTKQLEDLRVQAPKYSHAEVGAARLQIRMEQFECLISAAVEAHMLDVAELPMDDQRSVVRR